MNAALYGVIHGWQKAELMATALQLGVYDALVDGPKNANDIADATKLHAENVFRMLRASAVQGLVDYDPQSDKFALNELSRSLTGENSWAPVARHLLSDSTRSAWHNLHVAVKDDKTPFEAVYGMGCWDYYTKHPEVAKNFNGAMTKISANAELFGKMLAQVYPFTSLNKIVDVGGGEGQLMAQILRHAPQATGVVFDLPDVVAGGKKHENEYKDLNGRLSLEGGDFFAGVPAGGDAYVMKVVLHDWNDEGALKILQSIHKSSPDNAKVLIIEHVIGEQNLRMAAMLDMQMMVICNGKERTSQQFSSLLDQAGFKLTQVLPIAPSPISIIEAVKK